jgi:hypothetical protein
VGSECSCAADDHLVTALFDAEARRELGIVLTYAFEESSCVLSVNEDLDGVASAEIDYRENATGRSGA